MTDIINFQFGNKIDFSIQQISVPLGPSIWVIKMADHICVTISGGIFFIGAFFEYFFNPYLDSTA